MQSQTQHPQSRHSQPQHPQPPRTPTRTSQRIRSVAVLGVGEMGLAILRSAIAAHPAVVFRGSSRRRTTAAAAGADLGITVTAVEADPEINARLAADADLVVLAVKPDRLVEVFAAIAARLRPGTIVVSVAAGVTLAQLTAIAPPVVTVVRAMPNAPIGYGSGMVGLASQASEQDALEAVVEFFAAFSSPSVVAEDRMNLFASIVGAGPAYVLLFAEEFAQAAVRAGMAEAEAIDLVGGVCRGAAEMLTHTGAPPGSLVRQVTSAGGTSEQAVRVLRSLDRTQVFDEALSAHRRRAEEIAAAVEDQLSEHRLSATARHSEEASDDAVSSH